jgi:hypothetical protein
VEHEGLLGRSVGLVEPAEALRGLVLPVEVSDPLGKVEGVFIAGRGFCVVTL